MKGNVATTSIEPYALPKMEPKSQSASISMDSDDKGEADPNNIAGNKHDITVLGALQIRNSIKLLFLYVMFYIYIKPPISYH